MHLDEVGQVVIVGVAVVDKPTFLYDQLPGVNAGAVARVPTQRPLSRRAGDGFHRLFDSLPFAVPVHLVVLFPAIPVSHDLVA